MSKRIFQSIVASSLIGLLLCVVLLGVQMDRLLAQQRMADCHAQAVTAAALLEAKGVQALDGVKDDLAGLELTWIGTDGEVRYDSGRHLSVSDNLAGAPEVKQALDTGSGMALRNAVTAASRTDRYALRLTDGTVLRVSGTGQTAAAELLPMLLPLLGIAALLLLAAAWLAGRVTKAIVKPINETDLYSLDDRAVCEELRPMVRRVCVQSRQNQRQIQRQMNNLKREYEKQDRMRRDFTANVSHELKTPLTSISGYAEIIREGLVKTEDISRFAGKIYEEAQRLIALVGDILNLSQLDDGYQVRERRGPVDLYAACERTIASLHDAAERRHITFSLQGSHCVVEGVEKIISEIAYNLCDNAIKYNKENGSVEVLVTRQGDRIVLAVEDTGIGIPEGETERVFERFYRVDKSHSKEIGGTGLGLSIVKHAAAYHDARIELSSALGEGTQIRVLFHVPREGEAYG